MKGSAALLAVLLSAAMLAGCSKLSDTRRECSGPLFKDIYRELPLGDTLTHAATFLLEYLPKRVVTFSIVTAGGRLLELEALEAPPRGPLTITLSERVDATQYYGTDMITLVFTADGWLSTRTCEAIFSGP
jgi:hypothetical protein